MVMYWLVTHVKTLKINEEKQCKLLILRENKQVACTHRCTYIIDVHTGAESHCFWASACNRKMPSLPCTHLAALRTLAWVTLGWWADGILTWSPVQGWRRHRLEDSDSPQNSECSVPVSGGHFLLIPENIPPTHEVSYTLHPVQWMLTSVVLQRMLGSLSIEGVSLLPGSRKHRPGLAHC